jgi:hypothetical protein
MATAAPTPAPTTETKKVVAPKTSKVYNSLRIKGKFEL